MDKQQAAARTREHFEDRREHLIAELQECGYTRRGASGVVTHFINNQAYRAWLTGELQIKARPCPSDQVLVRISANSPTTAAAHAVTARSSPLR